MPHAGPDWSIASSAAAILAELDTDGNGTIDRAELAASPAWRSSAERLDANGDGLVDLAEVEARVSLYRDARDIGIPVRLVFQYDGRPLAATVVRLVPDPAIAALIPAVEARTGADGAATFNSASGGGVLSGAYRIGGEWPMAGLEPKPGGLEVAADSGGITVKQTVTVGRP